MSADMDSKYVDVDDDDVIAIEESSSKKKVGPLAKY